MRVRKLSAPLEGLAGHSGRAAHPAALMARVYLSLGSNLGDRLALLQAAVARLRRQRGHRLREPPPSLYETEPWESEPGRAGRSPPLVPQLRGGHRDDADAHGSAEQAAADRDRPGPPARRTSPRRPRRFMPRPLDIDILFYEDRVISIPDRLQIPHLLLHERAFVLRPLVELAPELEHPTLYQTVRDLLVRPRRRARRPARRLPGPLVRGLSPTRGRRRRFPAPGPPAPRRPLQLRRLPHPEAGRGRRSGARDLSPRLPLLPPLPAGNSPARLAVSDSEEYILDVLPASRARGGRWRRTVSPTGTRRCSTTPRTIRPGVVSPTPISIARCASCPKSSATVLLLAEVEGLPLEEVALVMALPGGHGEVADLSGQGAVAHAVARLRITMSHQFPDLSDEALSRRLATELPRHAAPPRLRSAVAWRGPRRRRRGPGGWPRPCPRRPPR